MLSTNWASVCWGITPLAPCTNIKNYWSAKHSCASNIRNYMSYVNYAATNQIYVFSCIFIDVIIICIIRCLDSNLVVWKGQKRISSCDISKRYPYAVPLCLWWIVHRALGGACVDHNYPKVWMD